MQANIFTLFGDEVEVMNGNAHTKPKKIKNSFLKKMYPMVMKASLLVALLSVSPKQADAQTPKFRRVPESSVLFKETMNNKHKIIEEFKNLDVDSIDGTFKTFVLEKLKPFYEKATNGDDRSPENVAAYRALDFIYETGNYEGYTADFLAAKKKELEKFNPDTFFGYGVHEKDSPVIGKYSKAYEETVAKHEENPNQSYIDFVSVLYTSKTARFKMFENLSQEEQAQTLQADKELYFDWFKKEFAVDTLGIVEYSYMSGVTHYKDASHIEIKDNHNKFIDGEVHLGVHRHEIIHAAQRNPEKTSFDYNYQYAIDAMGEENMIDAYDEFAPTIEQIVHCDEVYKKVKGIGIDTEVEYPYTFKFGDEELNPGKLANFMREQKNTTGCQTYFELTQVPEVIDFINEYGESFRNSLTKETISEKMQDNTVKNIIQQANLNRQDR